jgi:hypothetical protein
VYLFRYPASAIFAAKRGSLWELTRRRSDSIAFYPFFLAKSRPTRLSVVGVGQLFEAPQERKLSALRPVESKDANVDFFP